MKIVIEYETPQKYAIIYNKIYLLGNMYDYFTFTLFVKLVAC